jgi:hypothetical protein
MQRRIATGLVRCSVVITPLSVSQLRALSESKVGVDAFDHGPCQVAILGLRDASVRHQRRHRAGLPNHKRFIRLNNFSGSALRRHRAIYVFRCIEGIAIGWILRCDCEAGCSRRRDPRADPADFLYPVADQIAGRARSREGLVRPHVDLRQPVEQLPRVLTLLDRGVRAQHGVRVQERARVARRGERDTTRGSRSTLRTFA